MSDPVLYTMKGCTVLALSYSRARKTTTDMIPLKPDKHRICTMHDMYDDDTYVRMHSVHVRYNESRVNLLHAFSGRTLTEAGAALLTVHSVGFWR